MSEHQNVATFITRSLKDTIAVALVHEALLESGLSKDAQRVLLAEAGIERDVAVRPDTRVCVSKYATLWKRLEQTSDDLFFGMDPRPLRRGSLEFLCKSSMAQPTLADGLACALTFLGLMLERYDARLLRQQSVAQIVLDNEHPTSRSFADFTFWMIVHGVACWLCGRRIPILGIELRSSQPDYIDDYVVMFTPNLRFERPCSRMIFAADCLDLPIRRTAAELDAFLQGAPGNLLVKYRDPQSLGQRIRSRLKSIAPSEWPRSHDMAQSLYISDSTLRRRLAEEAQSYQALKDSLRKELAVAWLADEELDLASIAGRLGFADPGSFHKAFRKWSGTNPGHYRSVILAGTGKTGHPD